MQFQVLGPICVSTSGVRLNLHGNVSRRVLTTLMLSPGVALSTYRIAEAVWGSSGPATADHQVRKAVAQMRHSMPGVERFLLTDGRGYRLEVGPEESDLVAFQELRALASRLASQGAEDEEVIPILQDALALFNGPVAADIIDLDETDAGVIRVAAQVIEEQRLAIQKDLMARRLRTAPASQVIGDLRDLIAKNPLEEELRAQLMLALYHSGRRADSLAEYAEIRTLLRDELGIDPHRQLNELHGAILRGDVDLSGGPGVGRDESHAPPSSVAILPVRHPTADSPTPLPGHPRPCTLPPELIDFVGRREEVDSLVHATRASLHDGSPTVVCIDGMAGSGKTAVAIRAAYRLVADCPDGQFYVNLQGFSPGVRQRDPVQVLGLFLYTLGVPPAKVPDDLDGRMAMWRCLMADAKVLLLLDNAADEAQVAPLLPPGSGSLVMVTSRRRMSGLDGAQAYSIAPMTAADSRALVTKVLGEERVAREPQAIDELIEQCAGLPLALRLSAARLHSRPLWPIAHLVERLSRRDQRLAELCAGGRSVHSALTLSFEALTASQQRLLCFLGLLPVAEIDVQAAAALLDTSLEEAESLLEGLLDANLLEQRQIGRYCMHGLVAAFAAGLCTQESAVPCPEERRAAVSRLLGFLRRPQ
ncbi:BTAD domain-containing putative transcriptional regulator [Dermacoccus sp. Tok2021]|uniref:AfsR/SARP family transcriptional regulator n=1 Tax=Dermacoccus sp. Tok2021 TaxID=2826873 RepID=UPI001CA605A8|nr:BTAD domain-containing putative transcriptional regulator [Dermacoccus sp. Tok2021]MBZ4497920.1 hypothetical protein [Dermacoccus sp. Tok2021]